MDSKTPKISQASVSSQKNSVDLSLKHPNKEFLQLMDLMDSQPSRISQALVPSLINAVDFFIKNPNK